MKKTLLAVAVLGAFAGAASAQTSVTVYGSYDAGIRSVNNAGSVGVNSSDSKLTMSSGGTYKSNRIGFKGQEDLGGGMNAHFMLETGFNTGTGALGGDLFGRSSYVGLGGSWGTLDLGRQYSVNFKTIGAYDPFTYNWTGIVPVAVQGGLTRLNNDIQYTGKFGDLTLRAEHALGEVTGNAGDGAATAVGAVYAAGPVVLGGAYTARKNNVGAAGYQDQSNWTIGGAYTMDALKLSLGYADNKQENGTAVADTRVKDIWFGGKYTLSQVAALSAAYYRTNTDTTGADGRRNLFIVGGTYALSKRTNFYADIDNKKYTGSMIPANLEENQTGFSVGINHVF
jgi:predicted porin